jgi:hypothetical protein
MKTVLDYRILIPLVLLLGFAPFYPQPHIVEKVRMFMAGTLKRPIDVFDLFWHAWPFRAARRQDRLGRCPLSGERSMTRKRFACPPLRRADLHAARPVGRLPELRRGLRGLLQPGRGQLRGGGGEGRVVSFEAKAA